jgi:hypothetical protein
VRREREHLPDLLSVTAFGVGSETRFRAAVSGCPICGEEYDPETEFKDGWLWENRLLVATPDEGQRRALRMAPGELRVWLVRWNQMTTTEIEVYAQAHMDNYRALDAELKQSSASWRNMMELVIGWG